MKLSIITTIVSFAIVFGDSLASGSVSSSSLARGNKKIAIARTFSVNDAANLLPSFDPWKEFIPCDGDPSYVADLILVYSQSIQNSTIAMDVMKKVGAVFEETNGFGNCFDRLLGLGCNIERHEDIYQPNESSKNPLWVNGPNRQFERTVRAMQANNYAYFCLMEMDSVPVRSLWLDALVEEIDSQPNDFAILGSTYQGYKWDAFYSQLPAPLRMHINGNAVYNPNHPVLERLVSALEREARTAGNSVAYDLRLEQIMHESRTGEQATFHHNDTLVQPPKYSNLFSDMKVEWPKVVRETSLIANFAGTNIVPQYLGDDVVIAHGAQMFEAWNTTLMGNISLIVSDWDPSNIDAMLKSLETSSHPFTEIVVMVPDKTHPASSSVIGGTSIRIVPRSVHQDSMDVCTAPVSTRWMMNTNTYFQIRQAVPMLVSEGKPVVTFSRPTKESCFDYKTCVKDLAHAKLIRGATNRVFDDLDMVYNVAFRDSYCSYVIASAHESPSATEYMSYLEVVKLGEPVYFLSEREQGGLLSPFMRLPDNQVPEQLKVAYRRHLEDSTNLTGSISVDATCSGSGTESQCISLGCKWTDELKTCRSNPTLLTEERSTNEESARPNLFTLLIIIAIAGASVAVLGLMYVAFKKVSHAGPAVIDSVQALDGSRDRQNQQGGENNDVDSAFLFGSEYDYSKISGASFEEIDLNDGHFEETSGGVEYVQD